MCKICVDPYRWYWKKSRILNICPKVENLSYIPEGVEELRIFKNSILKFLPVLPDSLKVLDCTDSQLETLPILPKNLEFLLLNKTVKSLPNFPFKLRRIRFFSRICPVNTTYLLRHFRIPLIFSVRIPSINHLCEFNYVKSRTITITPTSAAVLILQNWWRRKRFQLYLKRRIILKKFFYTDITTLILAFLF